MTLEARLSGTDSSGAEVSNELGAAQVESLYNQASNDVVPLNTRQTGMKGFYPSRNWGWSQYIHAKDYSDSITQNRAYKILYLGDSIMSALFSPMRYLGKNYFGLNGYGFVRIGDNGTEDNDFTTSVKANVTFVEDNSASQDEWGISGDVSKFGNTSTYSYTHTDQSGNDTLPFNAFKIFYLKRSGGGSFRWRVDGGGWTIVDTSNATSVLGIVTKDDLLSSYPDNHLIEIEGVAGTSFIYGVKTYNPNIGGIQHDFINQGGSSAQQWQGLMDYVKEYITEEDPDQVHVQFGNNDYGSGRTATQFIEDIETIVTELQSVLKSYADIVVYGNTDTGTVADIELPNTARNTALAEYFEEAKDSGQDNNYSILDVNYLFPTRPVGGATSGMDIWTDSVHLNSNGGLYFANKVFEFCLALTNNYTIPFLQTTYKEGTLSIPRTEKFSFYKYTGGGNVSELDLGMYSLNDNRLYFALNAYGDAIMREYFSYPGPVAVKSYTVVGVPAVAPAGQIIYVSDEAGGAVIAFSDGTNWRRVTDRNIIS